MNGNVIDFPTFDRGLLDPVGRDGPSSAGSDAVAVERAERPPAANDTREQADAEWAQALHFSTLLIAGAVGFLAGSLTFAAIAFLIVRLS